MVLNWRFQINASELTQEKIEQLAGLVKKYIGFDNEEVLISTRTITAAPELGRRIFRLQTFRMALFDLRISKEKENLVFRFRYYTMYIILLLPALIFSVIFQTIAGGILGFGIFALFLIPFKWIENRIYKFRLESEIKKILNQTSTPSGTKTE